MESIRTSVSCVTRAMFGVLAVLALASFVRPAAAQVCIGDCDGNLEVTVDELLRGVSIGLGEQAVGLCPIFDRNDDDQVSVDEILKGVNSALQGCFNLNFAGICRRPGPTGLIPCAPGTSVRLLQCLDRSRCLFDSTARRLLRSGVINASGGFDLAVRDASVLSSLLLVEADVASGFVYRTLAFSPFDGGTILGLPLDPLSEAVTRVLNSSGLDRFSDTGIEELIDLIFAALA
ncbi:MAG TPA: hypothetical protein VEB21_08915, partial [Terriglobales bacterium]|nr:hypothetical protein [Terriglobales bacterium]